MVLLNGKFALKKICSGLSRHHFISPGSSGSTVEPFTGRRTVSSSSVAPFFSGSSLNHRFPVKNPRPETVRRESSVFFSTSENGNKTCSSTMMQPSNAQLVRRDQLIQRNQFFPPKNSNFFCNFSSRNFSDIANKTVSSAPTQSSSFLGKIESNPGSGSSSSGSGSAEEEEEKRRKDAFAKKAMKWSLVAMGLSFLGAAGFCVLEWGAPKLDEDGNLIRDEYSDMPTWKQFILRAWKEIIFYEKMIKEPSREKLLPDPLKEPYHQPPYTVVLEMTGVLVHPDWTYGTGWRFKKRPGVNYFLEQLAGPYFEIVIYTNEQAFTAYPILLSLDPNGYVMYRLFRDSTRYVKGKHIKDLSYLNRDLSKTIVVEWDPEVVPGHERNVVFLPKWQGNDDDRTLFELATFLKTIAASDVDDVRDVLDNYRNEDDILEAFKQRQQMLREEQTKAAVMQSHLQEEKEKRSLLSSLTPSIFGRR